MAPISPGRPIRLSEISHRTLGFAPFKLLNGRNVRGPLSILKELLIKPQLDQELQSSYAYVLDLRQRLEKCANIAYENADVNLEKYETYFDVRSEDRKFKPGDEVLLLLPTASNKLLSQWKGPYSVREA